MGLIFRGLKALRGLLERAGTAATRDRNDMVAREKLAIPQLGPVARAVLAAVAVTSEQEGVGDLATEPAGDEPTTGP